MHAHTTHTVDHTHLISFIDLTSLNIHDNEESISELCQQANTPYGPVAAICIYPQFVLFAHDCLKHSTIPIATVINFPQGELSLTDTLRETENALANGANEIDMVFPYLLYMRGEKKEALEYIEKVKSICQYRKLKVIIETGELKTPDLIREISKNIILTGADFIKTSTGKTKQGATLEAAKVILEVIKKESLINKRNIGLKISGGIRSIADAQSYIKLTSEIMGKEWIHPNVFRIGASKLLNEILDQSNSSFA
jgi:deoxyribose-phosphate aldolase